jgi:hypothetical protein
MSALTARERDENARDIRRVDVQTRTLAAEN